MSRDTQHSASIPPRDMTPQLENADTCVIVPMLNEESVISDVVGQLRRQFCAVVCVDDGSIDDSSALALKAGAMVVRHPVNLGQGAALQTGISFALRNPAYEFFVTFDADGQHRAEDAERMVAKARSTAVDVVLGSRFLGESVGASWTRRSLLRAATGFTRMTTGMKLTDAHNGLRVLNRRAASLIRLRLAGMAHASEIVDQIAHLRLSYCEHPVSIEYTQYSVAKGQSNLNAVNIAFDLLANRVRGQV